jgi:hypothetical protein
MREEGDPRVENPHLQEDHLQSLEPIWNIEIPSSLAPRPQGGRIFLAKRPQVPITHSLF